jgi:sRNA-binding protein
VEAIQVLVVELGAQIDAQTACGETPLQASIRYGHHQAAQLLRQLEFQLERTRKAAAARERAQQAARRDTPQARKKAERMAAQLIAEEEREQAAKAQSKVRGVELAPVCGVSDAVSLGMGGV